VRPEAQQQPAEEYHWDIVLGEDVLNLAQCPLRVRKVE